MTIEASLRWSADKKRSCTYSCMLVNNIIAVDLAWSLISVIRQHFFLTTLHQISIYPLTISLTGTLLPLIVQGALRGYSSPGKGAKNGVRGDREGGSQLWFFFRFFRRRLSHTGRSQISQLVKKVKPLYRLKWPMGPTLNSGFLSMKRLRVLLLPPGWDANPSQG